MTTIDVRDATGATTGSVELPAEIFDVTANVPLMHQVVVAQLAAARQGTHKTKTRGEVRGGGKKPYRQKGTGRARQGSTRAPQFTGGGVVHGPVPRDYSQRTPKKMKQAALRGALSDRARGGKVHVLAGLVSGEVPSTKTAVAALAGITTSRHVLVVCERSDDLTWKSLRNVVNVHLIAPDQLNTYDVLVSDDVVFTEAALTAFLAGAPKGKSAKAIARSSEVAEVSAEPATDAGTTEPAAADVPTEDLVEEVAEQTSKDLLVEPANEELSKAAEEETQ
jgi:large subunit ribosomal protein L4